MIGRVKDLEDAYILTAHLALVVEAEAVAPLGQVAAADVLLGDVLELVEVVQSHGARIADAERPLLDNASDGAPDAARGGGRQDGQSIFHRKRMPQGRAMLLCSLEDLHSVLCRQLIHLIPWQKQVESVKGPSGALV